MNPGSLRESHAVTSLRKSLEMTRNHLLTGFSISYWMNLSLILFLMAAGIGAAPLMFRENQVIPYTAIDWTIQRTLLILLIALDLLVFTLALRYLSSILDFVLIQSLEEERVFLLPWIKQYRRQGFSLFTFRLYLMGGSLAAIGGFIALLYLLSSQVRNLALVAGLLIMFSPILLLAFTVSLFILTMTTDLVVPLMHWENQGIKQSWRKIINLARQNQGEFLLYAIIKIIIGATALALTLAVALALAHITQPLLSAMGITDSVNLWRFIDDGGHSLGKNMVLAVKIILLMAYTWILSYLLAAVTLPASVFIRLYSLMFTKSVTGMTQPEPKPEKIGGHDDNLDIADILHEKIEGF